jgi:hypothetical protein
VTGLGSLRKPPPRYQLDRLLVPDLDPNTGKARAGFETEAQVLAEDVRRASGLRAIALGLGWKQAWGISPPEPRLARLNLKTRAASDLADWLEAGVNSGDPAPTLASASFMRDSRLRIGGEFLRLAEHSPHTPVKVFTAIHPSWRCQATRLLGLDLRKIRNQFRTHLYRAGVVRASGFLAACIHGEFEPFSESYQLHFHGICAGDKLKALESLRGNQGYKRTREIYRPVVVTSLNDPPRQISYLMQSFWPNKAQLPRGGGMYQRSRTKTRIREPYHSLCLLRLDKWSLSDLWLLSGIRIKGGLMILS